MNFKCNDGTISSDIIVVSNDPDNTFPDRYSNAWIVSSLPISDVDIWYGDSITVDPSQLFSVTNCPSSNWNINSCDLITYSVDNSRQVYYPTTPTTGTSTFSYQWTYTSQSPTD